jgi:hypothetical protein
MPPKGRPAGSKNKPKIPDTHIDPNSAVGLPGEDVAINRSLVEASQTRQLSEYSDIEPAAAADSTSSSSTKSESKEEIGHYAVEWIEKHYDDSLNDAYRSNLRNFLDKVGGETSNINEFMKAFNASKFAIHDTKQGEDQLFNPVSEEEKQQKFEQIKQEELNLQSIDEPPNDIQKVIQKIIKPEEKDKGGHIPKNILSSNVHMFDHYNIRLHNNQICSHMFSSVSLPSQVRIGENIISQTLKFF